jgi:hypothetical protein
MQIKRMTAKTQDVFGFDYGNDQQLDTKVREFRAKERMLKVHLTSPSISSALYHDLTSTHDAARMHTGQVSETAGDDQAD